MKVKKFLIMGVGLGLIALGCSVKNIEVPEAVDYGQTLNSAWADYDDCKFETANARFDSVIGYDVGNTSALLGKGWTAGQLGEYQAAISFLNLTVSSLTDNPPYVSVFGWHPDTVEYLGVRYENYHLFRVKLPDEYRPLVGILKFSIPHDLREWNVYAIEDSAFIVWTDTFDTMESHLFDSLKVDFIYFNTGMELNDTIKYAYVGLVFAYGSGEDYQNATIVGRGLLHSFSTLALTDTLFVHYPHPINRQFQVSLAYYYLMNNVPVECIKLLHALDSSWNFNYDSISPYTLEAKKAILEEINKLK